MERVHMELNNRMDKVSADLMARIERVDTGIAAQVAALAQEVGHLRQDREVVADILRRLSRLEEKVAA